ncbi:hypothetical protein EW146_g9854 [Bondarzewia mesenterica]|uniref:Alpha-type protein kinase domain-containing protein n=1 Tax=Bondarzewia mesenterica TaxID=1095465 RepID=A0A4S4L2P0_9AGAM|nr:hypothetical protein EW146_g9854 [Bondarzewia mesenterica]
MAGDDQEAVDEEYDNTPASKREEEIGDMSERPPTDHSESTVAASADSHPKSQPVTFEASNLRYVRTALKMQQHVDTRTTPLLHHESLLVSLIEIPAIEFNILIQNRKLLFDINAVRHTEPMAKLTVNTAMNAMVGAPGSFKTCHPAFLEVIHIPPASTFIVPLCDAFVAKCPFFRQEVGAPSASTGSNIPSSSHTSLLHPPASSQHATNSRQSKRQCYVPLPDLGKLEDHGHFLSFAQHVQYQFSGYKVYLSDFQRSGNLLTDCQVLTSEEFASSFGAGNLTAAFDRFEREHICTRYCRFFRLKPFVDAPAQGLLDDGLAPLEGINGEKEGMDDGEKDREQSVVLEERDVEKDAVNYGHGHEELSEQA